MFDLDRYLARIGAGARPGLGEVDAGARPSLADVHRAHVTSIPFENLDPCRGVPVSLGLEDLQRKLVTERRGGYCFEQNLLLKAACEALGAGVEPFLARVRVGAARGSARPRSHLVLRVHAEAESWHADVGFGRGTLLEPIPFGAGGPYEQAGWRFRVVVDGPEFVLQTEERGEWLDLYGFVPEPVPLVDIEVSNWFTSTYPRSPFVTGLIVCANRPNGARTVLSNWDGLSLTEQTPDETVTNPVSWSHVPELLERCFGLGGFAVDEQDRLVRAGDG